MTAIAAPTPRVPTETLLSRASDASRQIERFAYRLVSDAEGAREVEKARRVLALAVGLRRMLESWRSDG